MVYKMLMLFLMSMTLKMHKMFYTYLCNLATIPETFYRLCSHTDQYLIRCLRCTCTLQCLSIISTQKLGCEPHFQIRQMYWVCFWLCTEICLNLFKSTEFNNPTYTCIHESISSHYYQYLVLSIKWKLSTCHTCKVKCIDQYYDSCLNKFFSEARFTLPSFRRKIKIKVCSM